MLRVEISHSCRHSAVWHLSERRFERRSCNPPSDLPYLSSSLFCSRAASFKRPLLSVDVSVCPGPDLAGGRPGAQSAVALAASSETRRLYKLACFVFSSLVTHLRTSPTTYIWSPKVIDGGYALSPTDRVPFHAHTTHSVTGASLSPGHVFGTVFRPTCATRTLSTAVSGVNSKRFVLMLLPGRSETFVNCAI